MARQNVEMEKAMVRVKKLEADKTPVAYIPPDGSTHVEGQGFRVAFVVAGEDGFRLTGHWPYEGKPGQQNPWFWGPTLEDAKRVAREHNEKLGVGELEAVLVVGRSMCGVFP